ncbi:MAG: hypothetical protein AAF492_21505, partial [Verrucomicrobiota bacterium]
MSETEAAEQHEPLPSEIARRRAAAMAALIDPARILADTQARLPGLELDLSQPEMTLAALMDKLTAKLQQRHSEREYRRLSVMDEISQVDDRIAGLTDRIEKPVPAAPEPEPEPLPDPAETAARVQAAYAGEGYNAPDLELLDVEKTQR